MPFFARPDLSNEQFKQLPNSELSLSGQTQIVTTSGLTISDGAGGNVIVTAENAASHVGDVLTYDGAGKIKLLPSGSAGDVIYLSPPYKPTTSCTVGGLNAGTTITGCTLSCILEKILIPVLNPSLSPNYNTLGINPSNQTYEVGASILLTAYGGYNQGSVSPVWCGGPSVRTGVPIAYNYSAFGSVCPAQVSSSLSNTYVLSPYVVTCYNPQIVSGWVSYLCGEYAKDSAGANYGLKCGNSSTSAIQIPINGIFPYFYGKVASGGVPAGSNRPTPNAALVISGTKVVDDSSGNIQITWNSTADDYVWFATPAASTTKTKWANTVVVVDNGNIGGAVTPGGNLFPDPATPVTVSTILWNNQPYKVYVSNYQMGSPNPYLLKNS